jgi:ABC-type nitrate/sulfonate/bicarbonate transport system substrate-binding protein
MSVVMADGTGRVGSADTGAGHGPDVAGITAGLPGVTRRVAVLTVGAQKMMLLAEIR